ncbi:hypothetical protein ACJIZ3_008218 [Penstemon smallii]|uniref:Pentatricopeptide repeat-containing protein n=1 Tax=Penstemon smallii TaxID=265156 RepID=A0ABD3TAT8_9LAMI
MNKMKQVHDHTLRNGTDFTKYLITKLLEIPNIYYAHKLFDKTPNPTLFLYNKLIQAYSSDGPHSQCLFLYSQMLHNCFSPNYHSFTFLFAALARKQFDEMGFKDLPTWNSLIAGYAKHWDLENALQVFLDMPIRNLVSWTAVISGYSQNGKYREALEMYLEMEREGTVRPNEVTIACVLPACANLGAFEFGQRIETYARVNGYSKSLFVRNAVLELYATCGAIDKAMLLSWNTMIMGLAVHGRCDEALELYNQMLKIGMSPDDISLVGAILACTHGRMVSKGHELFNSMKTFGCMVDLLGRAGELHEAYELIKAMPMKPDSVIWGTLLGACSFHGNVELAESLFELEPCNPENYVILSNIYAKAKKWDGVAKLRKLMKGSNVTKAAGHSFIEEGGKIHKFIVLDNVTDQIKVHRSKIDFDSIIGEIKFMETV